VFETNRESTNALPLHHKVVTPVNVERLDGLSATKFNADADWFRASRCVRDTSCFTKVTPELPVPRCRLPKRDVKQLLKDAYFEEHGNRAIRGTVRIFSRPEKLGTPGARRRQLTWPRQGNMQQGRDNLFMDLHVSKRELRRVIRRGHVAYQADISQAFSHFLLAEDVRDYTVFEGPDGELLHTTRQSMGDRNGSQLCGAATNRVCDVKLPPDVSVHVATDNMRVCGPKADALAVFKAIIKRCRHVGFKLNEVADDDDDEHIESLVTDHHDYLGEHYFMSGESMCITDKVLEKLRTTWARRDHWLFRQWGSHMGTLLYGSSTLRVPMYEHRPAMRFLRECAKRLEADETLWDTPTPVLPPEVRDDLAAWTEHVLENVPVPVVTPPGHATHVAMADASRGKWSVAIYDIEEGSVKLITESWSATDRARSGHSAWSEPEAVYRAICRYFPRDSCARLIFFSDHKSFCIAKNAGFAKSYTYNDVIKRIGRNFINLIVDMRHVEGKKNIVDKYSRGSTDPLDEVWAMGELREAAGDLHLCFHPGAFAWPLAAVNGGSRQATCLPS
jgi:hypothetical protein